MRRLQRKGFSSFLFKPSIWLVRLAGRHSFASPPFFLSTTSRKLFSTSTSSSHTAASSSPSSSSSSTYRHGESAHPRLDKRAEPFDSNSSDSEIKEKILATALKRVPQDGWTQDCVDNGTCFPSRSLPSSWSDLHSCSAIKELGYSPALGGILPGGPMDVIEYHMNNCNQKLYSLLKSTQLDKYAHWIVFVIIIWLWLFRMTLREKLELAIKSRLEMNIPFINSWSQAMAVGARPSNICTTGSILGHMFDEVWHILGDQSTHVRSRCSTPSCSHMFMLHFFLRWTGTPNVLSLELRTHPQVRRR